MKILFLSNGFPPHRWAGTETYTAGIARELRKRGHVIQVLCAGRWEQGPNHLNGYDDDTYDDVKVRRLHFNWTKSRDPFRHLYDNPIVGAYLRTYLEEVDPDIVHVTSCETLSASVLCVAKQVHLPLVLSLTDFWFLCSRTTLLHGDGSICDGRTSTWGCLRCKLLNAKVYQWPRQVLPERFLSAILMRMSQYPSFTRQHGLRGMVGNMADRKNFLRKALNWPDVRITASPFVRDLHLANGVTAPIRVQAYGHDVSWLEGYTGKTPSNILRIGFIGQITESKGVHILLQAANSLQNSFGDKFGLSIYGNLRSDGEYSNRLRVLAANLSNVQFCGTYAHEHSADVFANLDVLVVPSTWHDFPLIIHEAFATKTPVIATNMPTMAENIADEVNGLLFQRGDAVDLAKQLHRLLVEPTLLQRLRSGIQPVKTIEEEVTELEEIYDHLVAPNT